ncbi:MAG: hypothetical protein HZB76_05070 [Chlamydiae bacterium]|nr:hypothetical protein [Chlamydiota bacterium]
MIKIIITFLPWIIFKVLSSFSLDLAIIAAIISSSLAYATLKKGFILEWGTLIFFLISFIFIVILNNSWFTRYRDLLSTLTLTIIAWGSVLAKRPFTAQYAKLEVSKEYWNSKVFLSINNIMSIAFGLLFLFNVFTDLFELHHGKASHLVLSWSVFGINSLFVYLFPKHFPNWYKKRYLKELNENQSN